jgi:hypothetical protein
LDQLHSLWPGAELGVSNTTRYLEYHSPLDISRLSIDLDLLSSPRLHSLGYVLIQRRAKQFTANDFPVLAQILKRSKKLKVLRLTLERDHIIALTF